jgi:hypothetical protein
VFWVNVLKRAKWGNVCKTDNRAKFVVRSVAMFVGNAIYFDVLYRFVGNL